MEYANGDKYVGDWVGDKKTGEGIMTFATGEKYDGQWSEDIKHGKGTYASPAEGNYSGDWVNGVKEGQGSSRPKRRLLYVSQRRRVRRRMEGQPEERLRYSLPTS